MTSEVTHLWACGKTILESKFKHKGNKQTKKVNSWQNLALFLAATDSENIIIQMLHGKGQTEIWTVLSSLGQEPTIKIFRVVTPKKPSE